MTVVEAHLVYFLAWLSFGAGHSLFAASFVKDRLVPQLGAYYRLSYNIFAAAHILAIWLIGKYVLSTAASFTLPNSIPSILAALSILGIILLIIALRSYDLGRLAGTTQIRNHRKGITEPEDEPLNMTGFHAFIRHPLYAGVYLIFWGGAQNDFGLATAIWGSVYLIIGTAFEERRLGALYGDSYTRYRARVPALIPWRGRAV